MPKAMELAIIFHDPDNLVPAEARWAAVMAAEISLQQAGVTLEECLNMGVNAQGDEFRIGEVPNFFDPHSRIADAWFAAEEAAERAIGATYLPGWMLRIGLKAPDQPH